MLIVSGKFDHRKQQRQLIINEIQTLATFEEQKLAFAKQIIIRNKSQIDMFEEMIEASKRMLMMLCYPFMMKRLNK
ncbi:hypothetical protein ACV566_10615 [Staphylococcus aureus]